MTLPFTRPFLERPWNIRKLFLAIVAIVVVETLCGNNNLIRRDFLRRHHIGHDFSVLGARFSNASRARPSKKLPGMLFQEDGETRTVRSLNGLWNFRIDDSADRRRGFADQWYAKPLRQSGVVEKMPVPSSFNDVGTDAKTRDFVGWAWYDKEFFFKSAGERVVLRFGSVHYNAMVWINGVLATQHVGGHLPFEVEVFAAPLSPHSSMLQSGKWNRVTVAVNNTLTPTTIPPGVIRRPSPNNPYYPPGYFSQEYQFDFYNYAGIHRPVVLYTTPRIYVEDITLRTDVSFSGESPVGIVLYDVAYDGTLESDDVRATIHIIDDNGTIISEAFDLRGQFSIANPRLWWPWNMNPKDPAYLYTFQVTLKTVHGSSVGMMDVYKLKFGIRSLRWTNKEILINNRPFYCRGLGKHEDSDLRGKGFDEVVMTRDFRLLKWLGCNCFRTSHYPYAEEVLNMADEEGIVVISESPGVGMKKKENFVPEVLAHHLEVMDELVQRDKNHPSVIMWSVANEPGSKKPFTKRYFQFLINHTKELDRTRPVTFVIGGGSDFTNDQAAEFVDIICINHYFAWYHDPGRLDVIETQTLHDLTQWHRTFNKSVILSEFGAGAVIGLHQLPGVMFTEDYQSSTLESYWSALDRLRSDFLVGEMIWNFADFNTAQASTRVAGNRKGLFTRTRQPKQAAYVVKERWNKMGQR